VRGHVSPLLTPPSHDRQRLVRPEGDVPPSIVKITAPGGVKVVGFAFDSNTNRLEVRMHEFNEILGS